MRTLSFKPLSFLARSVLLNLRKTSALGVLPSSSSIFSTIVLPDLPRISSYLPDLTRGSSVLLSLSAVGSSVGAVLALVLLAVSDVPGRVNLSRL